ncbi:MAG TPA: OmpA family protein [Solirubrobacteraceae bacterium]|nr:OmpA family protein [Solirubrobacteraceae bacterium]
MQLEPRRRRSGFRFIVLLSCTAGLLTFAAPASASHLKGGSVSAAIGANQHLTGNVELIYRSAGACPAVAGQLVGGNVQVSGPAGFSAAGPLTGVTVTACLPSTKTEAGAFDVDLSAAADGTYTITYSNCCRVTPIANVAGGAAGNTSYTATVHKSGATVTSTPSLTSNVALGVSTHAAYEQNLNATSPGGGALTYLLLQSATPAQPDYDATAPSSNIVSIDATGHVSIPAGTTSGLVAGTVYVYKVRVTTAAGESAEREILLTVSNNNVPALAGLVSPVNVMAGTTATLHFTATDPDGAQLVTILPAGLPGWAALSATAGNPADATITLTPPAATTEQDVTVNVDATDNDATAPMTDSRGLTLHVAPLVLHTTLGSVPAALSNNPSPSATFTGDPPDATFECSLDGGAWTPCASPWSPAAPVSDGSHTLRVRAALGGQSQPDPASASWTTDTTPPAAPTLLAVPAPRGTATAAAITFSGEPGATSACRLDAGDWAPCTSPQRYAGLAVGTHSMQVRQTDVVGNTGEPSTASWTVAPAPAPAPPPGAGRLAVQAPASIVAASDRPSVGCRAIGGALKSCTVRAYVRVPRRHRKPAGSLSGSSATVLVLVGYGRVGAVAAGHSEPVRLTLTPRGRRLLDRLGGVKVELRIAGRATSGKTLRSGDRVRLLPKQSRVVTSSGAFAGNSAWMSPSGRRSVSLLARKLHHVKTAVCTGYADSTGSSGYNVQLALARAKAVCAMLRAGRRGLAVRVRSAGENRPAASNRTAAGRAENRRVEVRLRYR